MYYYSFCRDDVADDNCKWHCIKCKKCFNWREWHCGECDKCMYFMKRKAIFLTVEIYSRYIWSNFAVRWMWRKK